MHNDHPHEGGDVDFHRRANETLCELADLVHVHFPEARELLEQEYGVTPERIYVMQHPLYGRHYGAAVGQDEARQKLGIDLEARVLLMFGYLRGYKGVRTGLESFLATKDPSLRLVVAGKPEDKDASLALQAAAEKDTRVLLLLGHVPEAEVGRLFSAADAFLFPSKRFFTSGSLMLALTYALPVIAAPVNHANTLVGRPFFQPWTPSTTERLTQIMDAVDDWQRAVPAEAWEQVRSEWAAEPLARGLAERLLR
ncbi:MAG: glycosyltransferase [Longimicrobiales bacterium]